ncbi:hypothetical protein TNCV_1521841 [Trichonephila clavipes]|nr:hypothetical protein TNCV_1521841 [Trichonephila clavipes]
MPPKHIRLQNSPFGRRYTSASVRISSGSTAGSHFSQTPLWPPAMLLSSDLMKQNDVLGNDFSLMGTGKSPTGLSLVNRGAVEVRVFARNSFTS